MSRTRKDLKSNRKGFGKFGNKPQRKLTPFIHDANKIAGKNEVLPCQPNNDINQDNSGYGASQVRTIRKQIRAGRDYEKSQARTRIKRQLKKEINNE
jgi:hypothetical protein